MKERPILFSAPMVRAIIEGRKVVTRRVMRDQPNEQWSPGSHGDIHKMRDGDFVLRNGEPVVAGWGPCSADGEQGYLSPYGQPGNRLWVKETFFAWGRWETRYSAKKGRDEWHFVDMTVDCGKDYLYAADGVSDTGAFVKRRSGVLPMYWKRPAIFMPRHVSRLNLEVTGVRVERLWDITPEQAIAEGIEGTRPSNLCELAWRDYAMTKHDPFEWFGRPIDSFHSLWASINGADSWDANPWVWVVEFRRVTP